MARRTALIPNTKTVYLSKDTHRQATEIRKPDAKLAYHKTTLKPMDSGEHAKSPISESDNSPLPCVPDLALGTYAWTTCSQEVQSHFWVSWKIACTNLCMNI